MKRIQLIGITLAGFSFAAVAGCATDGQFADSDTAPEQHVTASNIAELDDVQQQNVNSSTIKMASTEDLVLTENKVSHYSLNDFEQIALANNPTLKQINASANKIVGLRDQVGKNPNPTAGYFASQLADQGTDQQGVFIEQQIVRGNKLKLNQNVLSQELNAQMWELEAQRYRVLSDIRLHYYDALAAQKIVSLTNEFHKVMVNGVKIAKVRKEAHEASQIEVLQSEIQLNEIDLAQKQAEYRFKEAWQRLTAIAGIPGTLPSELTSKSSVSAKEFDWEGYYQTCLASSPELFAAQSKVSAASANLEREKVQAIPNLDIQFGAGKDNSNGSGLINLQVGAPIPVFNRNNGNISAAYAEYCRASHEVQRIELSIKARLAKVAREYDSANVAVNKYQQSILPKAKSTFKLSEEAYKAGELDFLQVLVARKTYFEANIQYVQAARDLKKAQAKLDGLLLQGALDQPANYAGDDSLRGKSLGGK